MGQKSSQIQEISAYSNRWGYHGKGLAIDINPSWNPYMDKENSKIIVGGKYGRTTTPGQ